MPSLRNYLQRSVLFLMIICHVVSCFPRDACKKFGEKKRGTCEKIFVWDKEKEAFVSLTHEVRSGLTEEEYRNFRQKTIRVIANNMMPYVTSNNDSRLDGFLGDIWRIIHDKFKFNYNVTYMNYEDGLKSLSSGGADVMLAAGVYKKDLTNVYYSHPYFYNWYHLYLKSPKGKPSSSLYLKTFNSELWISSSVVFSLLTASVWLTSRFLCHAYRVERRISLLSCFLGIVSGFINQGFDLKLKSYSGRLQVMLALIFGIMLYIAMNAALVAKIAVFEAPYPFSSLPDIAKRGTLSLCLRTGSFVHNNFTDENKVILPEWKTILNNKNCPDINDANNIPKIICNDNVIILENKVVMTSLSKTSGFACPIDAFQEKYFTTGNSYLLLRAFRGRKIVDNYVLYMRSVGVLQRLQEKWIENNKFLEKSERISEGVTMGHTRGVFIFYIVAIFVSLIILGLEIWHHKYLSSEERILHVHYIE